MSTQDPVIEGCPGGSVFAQLWDTFPFHLLRQHLGANLDELAMEDVEMFLRQLADGETLHVQSAKPSGTLSEDGDFRVWEFEHQCSELHTVEQIICRSGAYNWEKFTVADRVEFGVSNDGQSISPEVQVETLDGNPLTLPLSKEFLHSRWHVDYGHTDDHDHRLWPLKATLDNAVVLAFAYALDGTRVIPFEELDVEKTEETALKELQAGGSGGDNWGLRAGTGSFMPGGSTAGTAPGGEKDEKVEQDAAPAPHLLVVLSFATTTPRADFEPGEFAYVAKMWPHIMVKANISLNKVDAAVKLSRPNQTTPHPPADVRYDHKHIESGCHQDTTNVITPLLVTDTNWDQAPLHTPADVGPFWSDIFDYYIADFPSYPSTRYKVVDRDKSSDRALQDYGERRTMLARGGTFGTVTELKKVPGQGAFDNIHLAPALALKGFDTWRYRSIASSNVFYDKPIAPRADFNLDAIKMAPLCSHDCLHTHWRWGKYISLNKRFTFGFDATGAYKQAGAPMVPVNQDVWLTTTAANELLYEATARAEPGTQSETANASNSPTAQSSANASEGWIPPSSWQVFFHHGSAYVCDFNGTNMYRVIIETVNTLTPFWFKKSSDGTLATPSDSMAAYYWALRYSHNPYTDEFFERVTVHDLDKCIKF